MDDPSAFDSQIEYQPLPKGLIARIEEKLFLLVPRKKSVKKLEKKQEIKADAAVRQRPVIQAAVPIGDADSLFEDTTPARNPITGNVLDKAWQPATKTITASKKSFMQRLRFPHITKLNVLFNGVALIVFVSGSYILYTELPGRIELALGIIMIAIAVSVIVNRG